MESIEFLVSTMNRSNLAFIDKMFSNLKNLNYNVLIINQCNKIAPPNDQYLNTDKIRIISTTETGISKSRNLAIKNAIGDLCVICDDDTLFNENSIEIIKNAAKKNQWASVFAFKTITPEGLPYKSTYPSINKYIKSNFDILHISSIEIVFRRASIQSKELKFYEWLGLGNNNKLNSGEEVCFIKDCISANLKVLFINEFFVTHPKESSGKNYHQKENAMANGAIYAKLFPKIYFLWNTYFTIKRQKHYKSKYSIIEYFKYMNKGSKTMLNFLKSNK